MAVRHFRARTFFDVTRSGRVRPDATNLIVRQPPALYITRECGRSTLFRGCRAPILNPAAELRCKILYTVIGGDPAPAVFPTMGLPLDPTREPP
jgi:hypothetical protein